MHTTNSTLNPSPLWTACALPGDGPEYRFTAVPPRHPLRNPIRSLRARIRRRTTRKERR